MSPRGWMGLRWGLEAPARPLPATPVHRSLGVCRPKAPMTHTAHSSRQWVLPPHAGENAGRGGQSLGQPAADKRRQEGTRAHFRGLGSPAGLWGRESRDWKGVQVAASRADLRLIRGRGSPDTQLSAPAEWGFPAHWKGLLGGPGSARWGGPRESPARPPTWGCPDTGGDFPAGQRAGWPRAPDSPTESRERKVAAPAAELEAPTRLPAVALSRFPSQSLRLCSGPQGARQNHRAGLRGLTRSPWLSGILARAVRHRGTHGACVRARTPMWEGT